MIPDHAKLGSWIRSWIQATGAIHGFHNHSVWGGNPYRWGDFTSGHSTWASPFLSGLSSALRINFNAQGLGLLKRLIQFQTTSFQNNGEYLHIGFQVGESLTKGLIHNAMANVSLALTALQGKNFLPGEDLEAIRLAIKKNMDACRAYERGRPGPGSTCNQEYARIWGKIIFDLAFDERRWYEEIPEDLDTMIRDFHVTGIPDEHCAGTYRNLNDRHTLEPSEYYGLMICPLVLAYEIYGNKKYLEQAGKLCRHVVRSAWIDGQGRSRLHRLWYERRGKWEKTDQPMLIAGMGDTLEGIHAYLKHQSDPELKAFLSAADETYRHYQHPAGFFLSASGWQSEIDIAPSTAWHAHDFRYLVERIGVDGNFWETFFSQSQKINILLGENCFYVESGQHWMIDDYCWQDVYRLRGRKDETRFGRDMAGIGGPRALPDHFLMYGPPVFIKNEAGVFLKSGNTNDCEIKSNGRVSYGGPF